MSRCQFGVSSVRQILSGDGLDAALCHTLEDIRETLFASAGFANPCVEFLYKPIDFFQNVSPRYFSSSQRIAEVPDALILGQKIGGPGMYRGITVYDHGRILLNQGMWCISTLIHETLHSVSVFGQRRDLHERFYFLIEGLTEFLTGYIISKRYPKTYSDCWNNIDRDCKFTYDYDTRVWHAFCNVVPVSQVSSIYFWDNDVNWEERVEKLFSYVRGMGYRGFKNVILTQSHLPTSTRLNQECGRHFGDRFGEVFRTSSNNMDFSKVKP